MIKIFIDFDGTITRQDVGDVLFERFGGRKCVEYVEQYRKGEISAVKCFHMECDACGDVELLQLHEFLNGQEIDPTFRDFLAFCKRHSFEHYIVSDGMDYYINYILQRHGLPDVKLFANKLELQPCSNPLFVKFHPVFPYTDEVCDRCACCKRNHILTLSGDDDRIVYIGEGYSDRCPARFADVVFAKDDLLKFCRQENISFFEYQSFADITSRLTSLMKVNSSEERFVIRKRRRAELARQEIFIGE